MSAKKSAKPAPAAKSVKVGKTQKAILAALNKGGALSRRKVAALVEKMGGHTSNGRVADEKGNYGAVVENGWAKTKEIDVDGKVETVYILTAAGTKALKG